MSNYGPKNLKLYNDSDNARRKARNTSHDVSESTKTKEKCYSTKIGQKSLKQQALSESKKYERLNKKQPVKVLSKQEIEELYGKVA